MLEYTSTWAKGDAFQGKVMIAVGLIILVAFILIIRSDDSLYRGALIPLGFLLAILIGYGSVLAFTRPTHLKTTTQLYNESPKEAITKEYNKASTDHRNYSMLKKVWPVLILISIGGFFFVSTNYYKGLSIGLGVLFLTALIIDTTLHHRLLPYWEYLKNSVGG